ncbi:MAG: aminopeptidase N [Bdellovibrionaceae bacterium]|nr:aminopeptidase N [Bdellovibrio sp.]
MKKLINLAFLVLILFSTNFLASCGSTNKRNAAQQSETSSGSQLSFTEARSRSGTLQDIRYQLKLNLVNEGETFQGHLISQFERTSNSTPLFFDFQNGAITAYFVNGQVVTSPVIKNEKLEIPIKLLKLGANRIEIIFEGKYSHEGNGLYRFKDPIDNKTYVYTDFEPYQASQLFPCFDQPDLKAKVQLEVNVPGDWQVISTTREAKVNQLSSGQRVWSFPETPKLSTYVFALHAGPYKVWTAQAGKIPLRLFARQSLAKFVNPNEWFKITQQGFEFYGKFFNYPYPFKKYDQLIVPDFNWGGMENIAAVTYSERYISRGTKTKDELEKQANVILHEMAHMWFGDLVTMKWWNDLWLNESFASYMASYSLAEATQYKDAWVSFFSSDKTWGYWEDQLVTTHPIEAVVPDTSQALANFDGISYGKGASVLKQLNFYIGNEAFQAGVQNYFKKFQYSNSERKDFIGEIALASGQNLEQWSSQWLTQAGVDQIRPKLICNQKGKIESFILAQIPPVGIKEFRSHRTQIGFYSKSGSQITLSHKFPVTYQNAQTDIVEVKGMKCPDLVNPNEGDHDFAIAMLDERTITNLKLSIGDVKDPLARLMFWNSLYEMVRTADLPVQEFAQLMLKEFPKEKHPNVQRMFRKHYMESIAQYFAQSTAEQQKVRLTFVTNLEQMLWKSMQTARPGTDDQKEYFDSYLMIAESPESVQRLDGMMAGTLQIKGLKIDQDRRWKIIRHLVQVNAANGDKYLMAERIIDQSERGQQAALAADAARPDLQVKTKYIDEIIADDTKVSQSRMRSILYSMYPNTQDKLLRQQSSNFYKNLDNLLNRRTDTFLSTYTEAITPMTCDQESIDESTAFINSHQKLSPIVLKILRVGRQEAERCKKIRERSALYGEK